MKWIITCLLFVGALSADNTDAGTEENPQDLIELNCPQDDEGSCSQQESNRSQDIEELLKKIRERQELRKQQAQMPNGEDSSSTMKPVSKKLVQASEDSNPDLNRRHVRRKRRPPIRAENQQKMQPEVEDLKQQSDEETDETAEASSQERSIQFLHPKQLKALRQREAAPE